MVLIKDITSKIKHVLNENPQGMTITQIAQKTRINRNTVGRYLENLLVSGQVEMHRFGMKKIYALSQRVALSSILSISSELVVQVDSSLRIIYANEPFLNLVGTDNNNLIGKNIEYTPISIVFNELFKGFIENIKEGVIGKEWSGEFLLSTKDIHLFCRIIPTVFDDGRNGVSVILKDITERKISEAALFASEKRFQSLVEMLPQSIWECDDRGNVTFVNQRTYEMYGYDYEDVEKGMTIWQTIHPDDRERVLGDFIRASREEPSEFPAFHEFMSIRKDGSTFPLITYHVPIVHENKIIGMRGIGIDISERKRAEEALRESEGKLNAMLQSISDPVSMMDKDLTIMWANEPAKRYFGKDIIGKKCYEEYHRRPDPCEPYPCITLKAFLDGKEHQHVTTVIDHQGEKRFFECSANVALRDNSGKPVAVLEISRDITDKKKAQDAIIESEEKYQTLVNRANDVICVIQDGIIKIFNPRLPEIWGGSGEEIMGKPFTDFVHTEVLPELIDNYKRRISGESFPSIYETILMKKDGSKMFVELNTGVIEYEGRPANLVVARDISDRKKMEETLFETKQRLQNFISAIGDIAWETDAEARFVYVSPQVETILGHKPEELIGHTPFEFLHPDAVYMNKKKFQSAVESNEKSVIYVSQWTHKDGYDVLLESNAIPKYDRNGLFSGFIGIDRKRNNRVFL